MLAPGAAILRLHPADRFVQRTQAGDELRDALNDICEKRNAALRFTGMGSLEFSSMLVRECEVATSPGIGFGPGGDDFVRFALIENEQRIAQAVRNLKKGLTKLG